MRAQILLKFYIGEHGRGCLAADISEYKPQRLSGEVVFDESLGFAEAAGLFGGGVEYPRDLESRGLAAERLASQRAALWYCVTDSSFGLAVTFEELWRGQFGGMEFAVTRLEGKVDYAGDEQGTYAFLLAGDMDLGEIRARAALSLGTADTPTLLQLSVGTRQQFDIGKLADGITGAGIADKGIAGDRAVRGRLSGDGNPGSGGYDEIPLPGAYERPQAFFMATASLNLTEGSFLLRGEYQAPAAFSGGFADEGASGMHLKAALCFTGANNQEDGASYWLMASVEGFTLSAISPALQGADEFLGLEDGAAAVVISNRDQEIAELPEQEAFFPAVTSVREGLTFQARLRLSGGYLKSVLSVEGDCILGGYIPSEEGRSVTLHGQADKITFLSVLILSHVSVDLENGEGRFFLSTEGSIRLSFPDLGDLPEFRASLTVRRQKEEQGGGESQCVKLMGMLAEPLVNPLGIPHTVVEELGFSATSEETSAKTSVTTSGATDSQMYFFGKVVIGVVDLKAEILIQDMCPTAVIIKIAEGKTISIKSMVDTYTDWEWPQLLDISLSDGEIWYRRTDASQEGGETADFGASVRTKISILPEFLLAIRIQKDVFAVAAQLAEPVDFFFVRFSLKSTENSKIELGPKLEIVSRSSKTSFVLSADIVLFSRDMGNITIEATEKCLRGKLTFPSGFFFPEELGFSLDEDGINLDGCKIQGFDDLDFHVPDLKLGSGKCGLHLKDGIDLKTKPRVESDGILMEGDVMGVAFLFHLDIKSEASAFSEDPNLTLTFKDLALTVDKNEFQEFTFKTLIKVLGENIVSIGEAMFEQVLNGEFFGDNKEELIKLAKLLTAEGVTWAASEVVDYLVCKGIPKAVAEAFVAALASPVEVFFEGLGIFLGGVLVVEVTEGTYKTKKKAKKEDTDEIDSPKAPELSFAGDRLSIAWDACEGAEGYVPMVSRVRENGESVGLVTSSCDSPKGGRVKAFIAGSSEDSPNLITYGYDYRVRIYAWNDEGKKEGPDSSIYVPHCPRWAEYVYDCAEEKLYLSWHSVARVTGYELEVVWEEDSAKVAKSGALAGRTVLRFLPEDTGTILSQITAPRRVTACLRCLADRVTGPEVKLGPWYLYDLAAPQNLAGIRQDEGIRLQWGQVAHALSYRVCCRDADGANVPIPDTAEPEVFLPAEKLSERGTYTFWVRGLRDEIRGRISAELTVVWKTLSVPKIQELVCGEEGLLIVRFSDSESQYCYLLTSDSGGISLDGEEALFESRLSEEGLSLRMLDGKRRGAWCAAVPAAPIATPEGLQIIQKDGQLSVTWQALEGMDYGVELLADGWQRKEEVFGGGHWETDTASLPQGERIYLSLYAVDSTDRRRRSAGAEGSFVVGTMAP